MIGVGVYRVRVTTPCGAPSTARHVWKWEGEARSSDHAYQLALQQLPADNPCFDPAGALLLDVVPVTDAELWMREANDDGDAGDGFAAALGRLLGGDR